MRLRGRLHREAYCRTEQHLADGRAVAVRNEARAEGWDRRVAQRAVAVDVEWHRDLGVFEATEQHVDERALQHQEVGVQPHLPLRDARRL